MAGVTGDVPVSINTLATVLNTVPLVPVADLTNITASININAQSGKDVGVVIFGQETDGTGSLYVAQGREPDDVWQKVGGTGTAYVLPAATATVLGGVKMSAATADQASLTVAGADVASLVTSTNTALAALVSKVNAILAAERTAGQKVT